MRCEVMPLSQKEINGRSDVLLEGLLTLTVHPAFVILVVKAWGRRWWWNAAVEATRAFPDRMGALEAIMNDS